MKPVNNDSLLINENNAISAINEASNLFGSFVSAELERLGMRDSYKYVLKALMENDSLTQLEIVNITKRKAPTVSVTLRSMERDGLISRNKDGSDRRETHVSVTDKGKKLYRKSSEVVSKAEKRMLDGLSEKELKALRSTLDKMINNLN